MRQSLSSSGDILKGLVSLVISMALLLSLVNSPAAEGGVTIAVLGDSLAAGYGMPAADAFPARLEAALRSRGIAATVVNAGVSGDTTAGGLARLDWMLADRPDLVIVELGANDALRALDPARTEANLDAILGKLKERGAQVLLTGMRAPRNLGKDYVRRFDALYPRLARRHSVPLYPFFLEGVAGVSELNQGDGIHPNRRGVEEIVRRLLPQVLPLVREVRAARASES